MPRPGVFGIPSMSWFPKGHTHTHEPGPDYVFALMLKWKLHNACFESER